MTFPVYASSISIELHKDENNSFTLQWFYNDEPVNVNNQCTYQGVCNPLLVMEYLSTRILNTTYEEACNRYLVEAEKEAKESSEMNWFFFKLIIFIVLSLTVICTVAY